MTREPVAVMAGDAFDSGADGVAEIAAPGRLLEISVTDLALIEKLRLELARASTSSPARPGRARAS